MLCSACQHKMELDSTLHLRIQGMSLHRVTSSKETSFNRPKHMQEEDTDVQLSLTQFRKNILPYTPPHPQFMLCLSSFYTYTEEETEGEGHMCTLIHSKK